MYIFLYQYARLYFKPNEQNMNKNISQFSRLKSRQ